MMFSSACCNKRYAQCQPYLNFHPYSIKWVLFGLLKKNEGLSWGTQTRKASGLIFAQSLSLTPLLPTAFLTNAFHKQSVTRCLTAPMEFDPLYWKFPAPLHFCMMAFLQLITIPQFSLLGRRQTTAYWQIEHMLVSHHKASDWLMGKQILITFTIRCFRKN